jgi:uncharacterized protein
MKLPMRPPPYPAFGLTLVVNHACNLRCRYCYTGTKFQAPMPLETGNHAVRRAFASVAKGGEVSISFFGGEPLLESARIQKWIHIARQTSATDGKPVRFNLTTNGTITDAGARALLMDTDIDLAVSCDGTAASHDRHRHDTQGRGSHPQVEATLRDLISAQRPFTVVMVVRPDTLADLSAGLSALRALGVTRFTLSLDVWATWTDADIVSLARAVDEAADLWRKWLPEVSIDWFDRRIAELAQLASTVVETRCAFGDGEIAVAPSGRLYPCERLVGEDRPDSALQLPGLADDSDDFLELQWKRADLDSPCRPGSDCRCSNYIRTGNTTCGDKLLHSLSEAILHSLERLITPAQPFAGGTHHEQ